MPWLFRTTTPIQDLLASEKMAPSKFVLAKFSGGGFHRTRGCETRVFSIGWIAWNSPSLSFDTWAMWWVLLCCNKVDEALFGSFWVQKDHTIMAKRSRLTCFWKIHIASSLKVPNCVIPRKPHNAESDHTSSSFEHDQSAWSWSSRAKLHRLHVGY